MSVLNSLKSLFQTGPRISPTEAAARVRSGEVLLVDVREPAEWATGVAKHAVLLPLSDLRGDRTKWQQFLSDVADREILLYCASGMRSGSAARVLTIEGFRATNAGGLSDWASSGWPIVPPAGPGKRSAL